eukprot:m.6393 g.6393  ORF g.6393 m.6393 type:complete len:309 (-) comp2608_c0_seq1:378-1304(-)
MEVNKSQCLGLLGADDDTLANLAPANQTPVLVYSAAQCNLLTNLCAHGLCQDNLCQIRLDGRNTAASRERANVDHEHLALGELLDLCGLLVTLGTNAKKTAEEEKANFELRVDVGEATDLAQNLTDHAVSAAERGVDHGANADETTGNSVLQIVRVRIERDDAREDGSALEGTIGLLGDNAGADLNLLALLENTSKDTAASNAACEIVDFATGLVDVKGANDNEARRAGKVARGDGNLLDNVLADTLNVVLELGRDRDDGRILSNGALHKLLDLLVLLLGLGLLDKINLVLQNQNVLQAHNLNGSKVL